MDFPSATQVYHRKAQSICDPEHPANSARGKNIFITGGGRGIGAKIAEAFAKAGSKNIVLTGRTEETLEKTKSELQGISESNIFTYKVDVTDREGLNRVFADVVGRAGEIDVCVANAAYLPDVAPIKDYDVDEFWRGFEVNTKGVLLVAQAFLKNAAEDAAFICLNTGGAHIAPFGPMSPYAASKAGTAKLIEYLQAENPDIRAYSLNPGLIRTEMGEKAGVPEAMMDDTADDVHHVVYSPAWFSVWLASPQSAFLKGRFIWANWDVEELKQRKQEILDNKELFTIGLLGWPFAK